MDETDDDLTYIVCEPEKDENGIWCVDIISFQSEEDIRNWEKETDYLCHISQNGTIEYSAPESVRSDPRFIAKVETAKNDLDECVKIDNDFVPRYWNILSQMKIEAREKELAAIQEIINRKNTFLGHLRSVADSRKQNFNGEDETTKLSFQEYGFNHKLSEKEENYTKGWNEIKQFYETSEVCQSILPYTSKLRTFMDDVRDRFVKQSVNEGIAEKTYTSNTEAYAGGAIAYINEITYVAKQAQKDSDTLNFKLNSALNIKMEREAIKEFGQQALEEGLDISQASRQQF